MKPRLRKTPTDPGSSVSRRRAEAEPGFTLVELLIVVAVIGLLAVLAIYNFRLAIERTLRAADAGNLRAIGAALQSYYIDHGDLPPADREAGPFMSHGRQFTDVGNGPAAGGSWDGVPWLLFEFGYIEDWGALFCPKYLKLYRGGATIRGGHPRFHNFRYAYNSSALSSGGHLGGAGNITSGTTWLVRDLYLPAQKGWYADRYPHYPADYDFPWGRGDEEGTHELALFGDMAAKLVIGGTSRVLE